MPNFVFISPDFPIIYDQYCAALKEAGFEVYAVGGTPYHELTPLLKAAVGEYYYCPNLNDYDQVYRAVAYLIFKHGRITYLESNNEYWLETDARLRADFHIEGLKPSQLIDIKHKSKMKDYYRKANVKYARHALVRTRDDFDDFLEDYGYPLFIKPDVGVGASDSFKISNESEKQAFFAMKKDVAYIVEPFIEGIIHSYDAIVDLQGEVVFSTSHVFPVANSDIAQGLVDDYYYALPRVPEALEEAGRRVIQAFNIRGRNVHLEFFLLTEDTPFAKRGEFIGLEVNMRSPGGHIPNMMRLASGVDPYQVYAQVMAGKDPLVVEQPRHYAISVSRRKEWLQDYDLTNQDIIEIYHREIGESGVYPEILAAGMGDYYFIAVFDDLNKALTFKNEVLRRKIYKER